VGYRKKYLEQVELSKVGLIQGDRVLPPLLGSASEIEGQLVEVTVGLTIGKFRQGFQG
jgi:hypothetical protein